MSVITNIETFRIEVTKDDGMVLVTNCKDLEEFNETVRLIKES